MVITYSTVLISNCLISFSTSLWYSLAVGLVHLWYAVLRPTKSFIRNSCHICRIGFSNLINSVFDLIIRISKGLSAFMDE